MELDDQRCLPGGLLFVPLFAQVQGEDFYLKDLEKTWWMRRGIEAEVA